MGVTSTAFSRNGGCAKSFARVRNRPPPVRQTSELHRAVVDGAEPEVEQIQGVVLMKLPRPLGPLFGKQVDPPADIARIQVERRLIHDGWLTSNRRGAIITVRAHVIEQAADIFGHQIALERPRGVGVTEGERKVRDAAKHHSFVA